MKTLRSVTIVGVGLIGSSIGLAMKRGGLAQSVVGVGRRTASLRKAMKWGAVDRTTTNLEKGVAEADLVVVCTPVGLVSEMVGRVAKASPDECLLTDAGSTKGQIVADLDALVGRGARFVGSHPLAGGENSGAEHGRADLFDGRVVVVTPSRRSRAADILEISNFWRALGAQVLELSPAEHDRALAATSHLPHLVASAIAASTPERYAQLVATGWLDTTRVAAGDPALWEQIALANRTGLLKALDRFESQLAVLRDGLEKSDGRKLNTFLKKAKRIRDDLGS